MFFYAKTENNKTITMSLLMEMDINIKTNG
jgi:hypothetical protein